MLRVYLFILVGILLSLNAVAQDKAFNLIMRNTGTDTMWDGTIIETWGFTQRLNANPIIPSPTLVVEEGDSVVINVRNISQGDPHTIHLHGLDVDQANDGVGHTSYVLHHMQDSAYRFRARHAGTYIYHCHVLSPIHVQMGMYGSLIVRPKGFTKTVWTGGPSYDREYNWLTSEVDTFWHRTNGHAHPHDTAMMHDTITLPPYRPTYFLVNGKAKQELKQYAGTWLQARPNETVYVRLTNMGYTANYYTFPQCEIVESDGRPLPQSESATEVRVLPGERYGILLKMSTTADLNIPLEYRDMNNGKVLYTAQLLVHINDSVSGIRERKNEIDFSVYPNPSLGTNTTVSFSKAIASQGTLLVYDITGQEFRRYTLASGTKQLPLNMDGIPKGIYLLKINTGEKQGMQKWVIE